MLKRTVSWIMLILLLIGVSYTALNVRPATSWSNGGFSDDSSNPVYGTHDWIAQHALDWLPNEEKAYIVNNLAIYLYGTELPDNGGAPDGIGDTALHHIYYWSNESLQDDASAVRAQTEFGNALNYMKSGNVTMAVKTLGIMSHYIVDVGVFGHVMGSGTDWGAEVHHSDYETYVNERTNSYDDEFNVYLAFDGSLDLISAYDAASMLAYDTTFDLDGDLTCVWMDQNYDWSNQTFKDRCGESLNFSVNVLTDVLHTAFAQSEEDVVVDGGSLLGHRPVLWAYETAQSFKPTKPILSKVAVFLRAMAPSYSTEISVHVRSSLTGPDLTSINRTLTSPEEAVSRWREDSWVEFDFPDVEVIAGQTYFMVVTTPGEHVFSLLVYTDSYGDGNYFWRDVPYDPNWKSEPGEELRFTTFTKIQDIAVTDAVCSKTVVGQGYPLQINVALINQAFSTQTFNVTVYANSTNWVWARDTVTGTYGEAVVGTGTDIYIARGTSFYRYRPSDNSFVELAAPPQPDGAAFKTGTALDWSPAMDDYIFALYGAATGESRRFFYRYSISSNSWERLPDTPVDQGEGNAIRWHSALIHLGLFATLGGEQRPTYLYRFDQHVMQWTHKDDLMRELADPPAGMGDGASLVGTWAPYFYALRGEFYETSPIYDFWRYSIMDNAWTVMADIPAEPHSGGSGGVGDGGSLLYIATWLPDQADYIYALSGNQAEPDGIPDNRTYRYTISTNSWERLTDLPFGVGYYVGNRLAYADGHIYAWQGAPSTWTGGGDDLARYQQTPIIIETKEVTLTSGNSTTLTFAWNTSGFAKGNYTISAYAWPVLGEIDTGDNNFIIGWISVAIVGDVNADKKVDMVDLWEVARHFGIDYPDPRYVPNFDIDNNGKTDMIDLWTTAKEYGKIDP